MKQQLISLLTFLPCLSMLEVESFLVRLVLAGVTVVSVSLPETK